MPDSFIVGVLKQIPTYKTYESLNVIKNLCNNLPKQANILIIGAGQGAETILFNNYCVDANITVVDHWACEAKIKAKIISDNTKQTFINNLECYNVNLKTIYDECILFNNFIENKLQGPWDCIYYDALDGANPWEIKMLEYIIPSLWSKISIGGYMMGDDYYFKMPNFKMAPIIENFCYSKNIVFDFDSRQNSYHWLIKRS